MAFLQPAIDTESSVHGICSVAILYMELASSACSHSSNIESSMNMPAIADSLRDLCIVLAIVTIRAIVLIETHKDIVFIFDSPLMDVAAKEDCCTDMSQNC